MARAYHCGRKNGTPAHTSTYRRSSRSRTLTSQAADILRHSLVNALMRKESRRTRCKQSNHLIPVLQRQRSRHHTSNINPHYNNLLHPQPRIQRPQIPRHRKLVITLFRDARVIRPAVVWCKDVVPCGSNRVQDVAVHV